MLCLHRDINKAAVKKATALGWPVLDRTKLVDPDNPKVTVGAHPIGATLEMELEIVLAAINSLARPVSNY
eukprot:SAG22_NODE_2302_length_2738_cov_3.010610_2_plen_70_part_00